MMQKRWLPLISWLRSRPSFVLHVRVILEVGSRRILQCNVTAHTTAEWTLQQLREALPSEHGYRFLIYDHESISSAELDEELAQGFGLRVSSGQQSREN
jgi:hypothetical protein